MCASCGMKMAKGRGGPCCVDARGRGGKPVEARSRGGVPIPARYMGGAIGMPIQGIGLGGGFLSADFPGNRFGFKKGGRVPASLF